MAQIVHRAGEHGTRNLEKNKAGTGIDVGLGRTFKCDQSAAICKTPSNKSHERRTRGE